MNREGKFVVLERLQGINKGTKTWTLSSGYNPSTNLGSSKVYKEILYTNSSEKAMEECNRKTDNDE